MKIAINSTSLNVNNNVSGVSTLVKNIIESNRGVSYIHLLIGKADNEKGVFKRIGAITGSYGKLLKLLSGNSFDLLHLNIALYPKSVYRDAITFALCKAFRKKVLLHLHGGPYLLKKPGNLFTLQLVKYLLKNANKVIVLSALEKSAVEQLYNIRDIAVLPNAVDINVFRPEDVKRNINNKKFLFLGRLHESKGIRLMISAFEALQNRGYPVELLICGAGPLKSYIEAKAKENRAIEFRGAISGQQKIDTINECEVFVLPSLYGEGLPMALLETMACGLVPVVSTDGSMGVVIENEINGLTVKINDLADLINAMETVLKDNKLMETISANARATVVSNYNWDNYLTGLNSLYTKIYTDKTVL